MSAASRLLTALVLCAGSVAHADDGTTAGRAFAILSKYCYTCHGQGGSAKGGLWHILDRERLVQSGLLVPKRPEESDLLKKVLTREMPPTGKPRPDTTEIATLKEWITIGAPDLPALPRTFIPNAEVVRRLRDDLNDFPARQRRHFRYLVFTHQHNAGKPASDMQLIAPALSKLVNSLSWHPRVTKPIAIDPAGTIFRLDLRDYRWTARTWERLTTSYPYRVPSSDPNEVSLSESIGANPLHLRGDWFLANASRGKLYYDLLDLPITDRAVERLLQLDVARNHQEETVLRAGFNGSGVSRNNRAIERHDAAYGALWRSHDFSDNTKRQNIFENPLGPAAGRHSFSPAGGELIFHLPNGLFGYLLVNAAGQRVEKGPVEIVSDPQRPDRQVEAGLSCMTCHGRGLLPKDDQVRAHVEKNATAFPSEVVENVRSLYVPSRRLRTLMEQDTKRYLSALEATGVPSEGSEPISTLTLRYEGVADQATVAAEFGLRADEFARRLSASPSLQRILGALQARGGTVQRQLLEEQYIRVTPLLAQGEREQPTTTITESRTAFYGHTDAVRAIALSPDGKLAASTGQDQTVRLWDFESGRLLRTMDGHEAAVNAVVFSGDGTRLLSCSDDRTLRQWDVTNGKMLQSYRGHLDRVRGVVFLPDGKRALSSSQDRTLRLWDLATGETLKIFKGHANAVTCVAVSTNGKLAVSGDTTGQLHLWDVNKGQEKAQWEGHRRGVLCVAFSPNGKQIVSGGEDRTPRLWDVDGGKPIRTFSPHVNAILTVSFTANGSRILTASNPRDAEDRFIRIHDAATGKEVGGKEGAVSVWCGVGTPDGKAVLTGGTERRLQRWNLDAPGR